MNSALSVATMKAASNYHTVLLQSRKCRKKSRLGILLTAAVAAFAISTAQDVNGFTVEEALFTAGGGETKELGRSHAPTQEGLAMAFAEANQENADTTTPNEEPENPDEGDSDTDDSEEELPPLSPTVEKFDEAMKRACSPSIKESLFKDLEQSVLDAMGVMDRWMNSVLGAMTTLESDSTALYAYLSGTGSLTDVIKSSCLFGLSILAGIIFACLVISYQRQGVQGAKQAYCQAYVFTDEILRGSASLGTNDTRADAPLPDEFEGLLPLVESVETLALLVDGTNPNNILELSKQAATNALDVVALTDEMENTIKFVSDSCISFYASNSLSGCSHKSLFCDLRKSQSSASGLVSIEKRMSASAKEIIKLEPKKYVDELFDGVTLPALNIESSFPTESVKKLFFTVFDVLGESEETVSKVLGWLEVALCVDCAIYLAILLMVVLWLAWFFFRGRKTQSLIPAIFWNILALMAVILLVVGGLLGWTTTLGRQGCSILINNCLEQDQWDLLSDYAPVVEPLISQCLTKEGDGDLLAGVGVDAAYDEMLGTLQETLNGFPTNISPLDKDTSKLAENYLSEATVRGSMVVADPDSVPESRKKVFPEFLKSGMQLLDAEIGGETIYGLETLESLVAPWKLSALHPDEAADGEFIVREDNPNEADPNFIKWLEDLKERKIEELTADGLSQEKAEAESELFKVRTKNGLWWLQQKQKVLDLEYKCEREDGTVDVCGFAEMFGLKEEEQLASSMYNNQRDVAQTYLRISSCFVNAVTDSIGVINENVIFPLERLKKSLNCRFLRRNIVQMAAVAMYRALGGGIACLVVLALFMFWSSLKGDKSAERVAGSNA
ncbi:uncharacterized protein EMH_0096570 [Eimeria mitis]|uniref:Uncharacterized protein n=1 Tax=Eimeria mitis TaxID=44415 RepID=U6JR73_9EIME|nr:uncharacterized protein EMH_0096570 [Eimeria mitis]CDJ27934.1 hypothetical protein, conserved [Eimeria mitis]